MCADQNFRGDSKITKHPILQDLVSLILYHKNLTRSHIFPKKGTARGSAERAKHLLHNLC